MRRHPAFRDIRHRYWLLNREVAQKQKDEKLKGKLELYLIVVETIDNLDRKYNYFRQQKQIVRDDLISAVKWEIQSLESDINECNYRIEWNKLRIRQQGYQLG